MTHPAHRHSHTMTAPHPPARTLAQKLIARACRRPAVAPGEIVSCPVDLAMFHDSSGPRRLDQQQAEAEGVMAVLRRAGAERLPTACGACSGYGGDIPDGATVIATTARNFKGRMGAPHAQVYLASPYTVAASALRGRISDPREAIA